MGKQNVKSGVGTFSNINGWKRAGDTRGGGERELDRKRGETTSFLSFPFVEFPCQSPAAESQPRINFKGRLGTTQKCRGNNIFPRPTQPKNGLRTKQGTKATVSAGRRVYYGTETLTLLRTPTPFRSFPY